MIEEQSEKLVVLLYTLNSGLQRTANLSRQQVLEFIDNYKNNKKYICTSYNETYGFNPDLIADFKILDLYQKDKHLHITEIKKDDIILDEIINEEHREEELEKAYKGSKMPFKIDCKCGRTYTVEISSAVNRGNCNACNEPLFVDRSIGKVETHKGEGWLMTNKYFVPREMTYKIGESI